LADGAVTGAKLAAKTVAANAIVDGTITSAQISVGGVTANAIGNDSVALGTKTTGNYVQSLADAGSSEFTVTNGTSEGGAATLALASKGITASKIADGTITSAHFSFGVITEIAIVNDSVALGTKTSGNYVATVSGTANEIEVSGSGSETAAVTIGLPDDVSVTAQLNVGENLVVTGNTSIGGDLQVDGDLTVTGATTYLSTSTVYTDDGMFKLSANNAGDVTDTGIYAKYVVSGNSAVQYTGYFRDATDGAFKFYTGLDAEPTATVNTADTGYTLAQVDAIIDGGTY